MFIMLTAQIGTQTILPLGGGNTEVAACTGQFCCCTGVIKAKKPMPLLILYAIQAELDVR